MIQQRIGLIGAGQMATALAAGITRGGVAAADAILASDPIEAARGAFVKATGARATADNLEVAAASDVIFLAVKPHLVAAVGSQLAGKLSGKLLISICAGIRLDALAAHFGGARLVRVMPNTPCLVGQGACGYCLGQGATGDDAALVEQLLGAVGRSWRVEERLMDAVTGLSGSGPAFVYMMIEALSDGGVRMGLPRPIATALAAQTLRGAAEMVLATGDHPGVLKDRVASPGGTTIAGIQALEQHGVRAALMAAVQAAAERSLELGKG